MYRFEEEEEKIQAIISKANLPEKGRILDIGTGMGWMASSLAKRGYDVITIEDKPEFQFKAKELAERLMIKKKIEFIVGNITEPTFSDESFDVVVSYLTLHHSADVENTIERMIELCKKGGKILFVELTKKGMEMVSKHHADHVHQVVDVSYILNEKKLDIQVFSQELTNTYVCKKK